MKKLIILGGGESGTGAALLAKKQGFSVFLSDKNQIQKKYKKILIQQNIQFEEGNHNEHIILSANQIIKSPGISDKSLIMKKIYNKNLSVISEIEFAWRYSFAKIIAITGSNGKTTTSLLAYYFLKKGGLNVALAGNIGKSFSYQIINKKADYYILEISSFQLNNSPYFRPDIAILLNITPDHLDHYNYNMQEYIHAKFRICLQQTKKDIFIYNYDDLIIRSQLNKNIPHSNMLPFSIKNTTNMFAWLKNKIIYINYKKNHYCINSNNINIQGYHNIYNIMAAGIIANIEKICQKSIKKNLINFQIIEHRLEKVIQIKGIWFINDSKATNVNAVYYAIKSLKSPIIWIAGGQDKGNNYNNLITIAKKKVKALICLGLDNNKLIKTFHKIINPIIETINMKEAVKISYKLSQKGDTVLLSPACASFDLFKNYKDRGEQFKKEVKKIIND